MENENNSSDGEKFAKEVGKSFLLSFAATAGATLGMIAGVLVIGYAAKKMNPVQLNTTPTITE